MPPLGACVQTHLDFNFAPLRSREWAARFYCNEVAALVFYGAPDQSRPDTFINQSSLKRAKAGKKASLLKSAGFIG